MKIVTGNAFASDKKTKSKGEKTKLNEIKKDSGLLLQPQQKRTGPKAAGNWRNYATGELVVLLDPYATKESFHYKAILSGKAKASKGSQMVRRTGLKQLC